MEKKLNSRQFSSYVELKLVSVWPHHCIGFNIKCFRLYSAGDVIHPFRYLADVRMCLALLSAKPPVPWDGRVRLSISTPKDRLSRSALFTALPVIFVVRKKKPPTMYKNDIRMKRIHRSTLNTFTNYITISPEWYSRK